MKNDNIISDIQKYFVLGILLLLIFTLFYFLSSFMSTLLIAGILVTGIYPVHKLLNRKIRLPKTISALISLLLVAVVILLPFTLFFFFIASQAADAYSSVSDKINQMVEDDFRLLPLMLKNGILSQWMERINVYVPISTADVIQAARDFVGTISSVILGQATTIIKHLSVFIIHAIVFLLAMFYFLKDGGILVDKFRSLIPLSETYRVELVSKLRALSSAIIYGIFGGAIAQGAVVGLGFFIVGIENAAFWGSIAALFSPLPYIGAATIWLPGVFALLIGGHWLAALFLFIWGIFVVSMVDNLVKPYLIGSTSALHPLAVLLVLLGGTFTFGLKGLIFGPFILTLTLAFLHIYELEYQSVLRSKKE